MTEPGKASGESVALRPSAKAVVAHDGRLLLTRNRWPDDPGDDWFILPGGGQRPGEPLADALRREVLEETGYLVEPVSLLWVRELIVARRPDLFFNQGDHLIELMFESRVIDHQGPPEHEDEAQVAVEWVAVDDLPGLRFYPEVLVGPLASWLRGGDPGPVYLGDAD